MLYFGLDGDDTGKYFEELFLAGADERQIQQVSVVVQEAIGKIADHITRIAGTQAIIFQAGDDILFKGRFTQAQVQELNALYATTTNCMTCSIGFGDSTRAAFLALRLAKAMPGKNAIVGIEIVMRQDGAGEKDKQEIDSC